MILVDTSVWVAALRGRAKETAHSLTRLLEADEVVLPLPVRLELSAGVAQSDRAALMRSLRALPVVVPTELTWHQVEAWIERAARTGDRFGLSDLLVAALADELGGLVWSLDADFERMSALKFVQLYG